MGEVSENEGDYTFGDMPWVWVFRAIYWTHKSWGLTQGSETPLNGCRAMWTNRRSVGSPDSPSRSMCSGACSQATMKRTDWDRICGYLFSQQLPTLKHSLLTCVVDLHWSRGCHGQADSWDVGNRGASGPGQHVGGSARVMLLKVTYKGSVLGEVLISDRVQTATADDSVGAKSPRGPHLPNSTPLQQGRESRNWGKWSAVRNQEVSDQKVCLSRAGNATDGYGTDGMLEVAWISVSSQPEDLLLLLFF